MMKIALLALFFIGAAARIFPAVLHNGKLSVEMDDATGRLFIAVPSPEGPDGYSGEQAGRRPKRGKRTRIDLLFYDKPPSSFTLLHAGESILVFGSQEGALTASPSVSGGGMTALWESDLVRVTQKVTFLRRRGTGTEDGILLGYVVENRSGVPMGVGLDIVLDTCLGEKGGAHFTLPSGAVITDETELAGDGVPASWLSMDGPSGGDACLRGVVRGPAVTSPDSLLFVNYRYFRENPFPPRVRGRKGFSYGPFSRNDSAVVIHFEPILLEPGTVREYRTILGLCGEGEYEGEPPLSTAPEEPPAGPEARAVEPAAPSDIGSAGTAGPDSAPPDLQNLEGAPEPTGTLPSAVEPSPVSMEGEPGSSGGVVDELDKIDRIIDDLNRYLEEESPPPSDEEIRRLEEDLEEIE